MTKLSIFSDQVPRQGIHFVLQFLPKNGNTVLGNEEEISAGQLKTRCTTIGCTMDELFEGATANSGYDVC